MVNGQDREPAMRVRRGAEMTIRIRSRKVTKRLES